MGISKKSNIKNINLLDKSQCTGCLVCEQVCNYSAIKAHLNTRGFAYPDLDATKCVGCTKCFQSCPQLSPCGNDNSFLQNFFIACSKSKETIEKSTSGGLFTVISDYILNNNGKVFGVVYSEESDRICFSIAKDKNERDKMRGSKYVQAPLSDFYTRLTDNLESNYPVLFIGTPCQVAAVRNYITNKHIFDKNLFLCDLICHGVGAPVIFQEYIEWVKRKIGDVEVISMRDKSQGPGYNAYALGIGGKVYKNHNTRDPYISLFTQNLILRSSCYKCRFKTMERYGDVTIGDVQNIEMKMPGVKPNSVSTLIVNTKKGKLLIQNCQSDLKLTEVDKTVILQPNLNKNLILDKSQSFWKDYKNNGFDYILKKYTEIGAKNHIKSSAKNVLRPLYNKITKR